MLKSRDDFDFRDSIRRGPVVSAYNGLQIENGGRDGTGILHRPPFDFVVMKRIHAYLAPRRPSRTLLRARLFLPFLQSSGCSRLVSKTRNTSIFVLLRKEDVRSRKRVERARALKRARRFYANLCSLVVPTPLDGGDDRRQSSSAIRLSDTRASSNGGSSLSER